MSHEAQGGGSPTDAGGAAASVPEEAPPAGLSWRRIYAAIVLYTVALIVLLYVMTVALER
jgi:hypothetical protein